MARRKKDIAVEYVDVMWNAHDVEEALGYLTPAMAESVLPHVTGLLEAFSDLRVDILQPGPIEEGDLVALRLAVSGTHDSAPFAGRPPSDRSIRWESFRIFRLEGDLIAETWAMQDRLGLMEQLGAVESRAGDVNWAAGD